jgi:hypothetical protein
MRLNILSFIICAAMLMSFVHADEFSAKPYLYSGEDLSSVSFTSFSYGNATAKLMKINGAESMIVVGATPVTDKSQIRAMLTSYYKENYYPSDSDLAEIAAKAKAFNASRNFQTRFGPAEQVCYTSGTFLSFRPCKDLATCTETASMVCTITGSEGCIVDLLAMHILSFKNTVDKLNDAYSKFQTAYGSFSAENAAGALDMMDSSFDSMKTAGNEMTKSKLRFPEKYACSCSSADQTQCCLGICPEANLDFAAITAGKAKIAELRAKVGPLLGLETSIAQVSLSTEERVKYRAGEEKAAIYAPRYETAKAKFGGLKAKAVEAKALVSDSAFISVADDFLNKGDALDQKLASREFDGFEALLSGYENAGKSLQTRIDNATVYYKQAIEAQDNATDAILQAQWRVDRLSKVSVESYNTLADKKIRLDSEFKPPKTNSEYATLKTSYNQLTVDARAYLAASNGAQESVFGVGNAFSRTSVDATMGLVNSMVPVSFKTRQSFAKFIPPLVVGAIDLGLLLAAILVFAGAFLHFRRFFHSKIAISGWVLTLFAFMFVLVIGSVGVYSIVISTERFTSFTEFMATVQSSSSAAIIVESKGMSTDGVASMKACADQVESQLRLQGKSVSKYYVDGTSCTSMVPKANTTNSTKPQYEVKTGLTADKCLDSMPDVPVFDLQYSKENQVPAFTTVVTKQALVKGNEAYYAKTPMCDIANVLG